jgi:hypothetical protein
MLLASGICIRLFYSWGLISFPVLTLITREGGGEIAKERKRGGRRERGREREKHLKLFFKC